ncbi:MAG TPA: FlgD immunoglobulin-like domain containing protein [Terriglobales bacterium]|nr:FlgD immunoglobulin-like domain containing protein [Terriglobales bacterium]
MRRHAHCWSGAAALAAAMILGAAAGASAAETAGAPGEWLAQYATARTLGLGGAYVATATDPLGALWNPAGLTFMDQDELRFENAQLYEQTSLNGVSLAMPGSRLPSFGVTMVTLRSGGFERTNEMNDALGTFDVGETAYLLTLARNVSPRLALGVNLKAVQQNVEESSGAGFGADVGGIAVLAPGLRAGLSLANLGGPSVSLRNTPENWPLLVRGGLAMAVLGGRGLVALEADRTGALGVRLHAGAEYWMFPGVALRGGYDDGRAAGGLTYRVTPQVQLDYAASDQTLGVTQRVGLAWRFGGFFAASRAEPEAFSPTGEHPVTRIVLNARTKAEADTWTLELVNKSDTAVRRFGGQGKPPSHLEWDGKDETGLPLPDGTYRYRLVVTDRLGRSVVSPVRAVEISTGGPEVKVPVVATP